MWQFSLLCAIARDGYFHGCPYLDKRDSFRLDNRISINFASFSRFIWENFAVFFFFLFSFFFFLFTIYSIQSYVSPECKRDWHDLVDDCFKWYAVFHLFFFSFFTWIRLVVIGMRGVGSVKGGGWWNIKVWEREREAGLYPGCFDG